jgi:hypothetical protein
MENTEQEFYIECRININASNYDVCFNRVAKIRDTSDLFDGYANEYTEDDDGGSYEVLFSAYYDSEKQAYKELKRLAKKYKWFFISEVLGKKGVNIFYDLYD